MISACPGRGLYAATRPKNLFEIDRECTRVGAIVQAVGSGLWVVGHVGHVVVIKRYRRLAN